MTRLTRRTLFASAALGAAAAPAVAQPSPGPAGSAPADFAALRAAKEAPADGAVLVLNPSEPHRDGWFRIDTADRKSADDDGVTLVDQAGRRWKRVFDGPIRAEWFGTGGVAAAHAAAAGLGKDLNFGALAYDIGKDVTLTAGRTYSFDPGAAVKTAKGVTLAIRGEVEAPAARIFDGEGRVIGIREVRPEWWGAVGDGKDDHHAALQAALDCVAESLSSVGPRQCMVLSGNYRFGATLNAVASASVNLKIDGGGTVFGGARLTAAADFKGDIALHVRGQAEGDLQATADWGLGDFAVVGEPGTACRIGLKIGEGGKNLIGLQKSRVAGVHISGFATCWSITNARLVKFENCSGWADAVPGGVALAIGLESVDFTGDIEFESCQFVAPQESGRAASIAHAQAYDVTGGGGQMKGIYFVNCTFYRGECFVELNAQHGAVMGDIWFDKCQYDGFGKTHFRIAASGKGLIENLRLTNNYFRGVNDGFFAIHADIGADATVRSLHITDNWIANCLSRAVLLRGIQNLVFDQNSFVECAAADSVVYLENTSLWQANLNALTQLIATAPVFVAVGIGSSPHGVAIGNASEKGAALSDQRDGKSGATLDTSAISFAMADGNRLAISVRGADGKIRQAYLPLQ